MGKKLTKAEAISFLGLEEIIFNNYFTNAEEFNCLPRKKGARIFFDENNLKIWKADAVWRTIELTLEDYSLCLDFALAQHFRGYVGSDFSTSRQREFGQKITNWVKGQLGEVALQKFLIKEYGVKIELDFNIYDDIVPQDIIGVFEKDKVRNPNIGVGIKSSKPKNAFLILSENELKIPDRRSDIYIFCRPDIPDDHLLRITKSLIIKVVQGKPHFKRYEDLLPDFKNIPCEIAGWCRQDELKEVRKIPGLNFEKGTRFVKKSGKLRRSRDEWKKLIEML